MLHGLFSDPRVWHIDYLPSKFWTPDIFGVHIDLHQNAFNIPKTGINSKYKFFLTSEVWEIPMQKTLEYLKNKGTRIFLVPREPFKTDVLEHTLFNYKKFMYKGSCFFNPDVVLAPNKVYANYWKGKTKCVITGSPRFDYLLGVGKEINKQQIRDKYKLTNKKIIFFPSYPPIYNKPGGGFFDIYDGREETLEGLEKFAKNNKEYQVVVKIHPMSFKCYKKGIGTGKEVTGMLLKYYKNPTEYMKVIGDVRMSGDIAKELLFVSDVVVGFTSTMLLEAAVLNKHIVHLLIGNTQDVNFTAYKNYFPVVYDINNMSNLILNEHKTNTKKLIEDYLFKIDGKTCERICDAIKNNI